MRVLLFGTFDLLHPGHRFVIEEGTKRGEVTVVVARDVTVARIKKHVPRQAEHERRKSIEEAYPAVTAILGDPEDYLVCVRNVKPDLILLGYDQQFPQGVTAESFPCPIERLQAFEPEKWKSSRM
ncbi:MAG: adenylyltransferase/cytidyltransferase family protein [Candidatus Peregrinibacteria bacterium]